MRARISTALRTTLLAALTGASIAALSCPAPLRLRVPGPLPRPSPRASISTVVTPTSISQ